MKLALVCDSLGINGAGFSRYEKVLIQQILLNYKNIQLFVFLPDPGIQRQFQFHERAVWIFYPSSLLHWLGKIKILKHNHQAHQFDCIHYLENIFWYKPKNCHTLLTLHDISPLLFPDLNLLPRVLRWWYQFMIKRAVRLCDHIITDSKASAKDIADYFRISPDILKVVHNGIPVNDLHYEEVNFLKNKSFILVPCTYQKRKNLDRMIQAFTLFLKESRENEFLVITGQTLYVNNPVYHQINTLVSNIEARDRIIFLNGASDDQMNWLYKHAKATFYVTLYEAFGYPIIESLLQGTPVLAGEIGSQKEIGGDYGAYCQPEDIQTMAKKLHGMMRPKYDLNEEQIKKYVCQNFSSEVFSKRLMDFYLS